MANVMTMWNEFSVITKIVQLTNKNILDTIYKIFQKYFS